MSDAKLSKSLAITTHIDAASGDGILNYMTSRGVSYNSAYSLVEFMLNDPGVTVDFQHGMIRYVVSYNNNPLGRDYFDVSMLNLVA